MLKAIIILALLLAACGGGSGPAIETERPIALSYVTCMTVTDAAENDDCAPGQTVVKRCSQPTDNPNEGQCTGPIGSEVQTTGAVWCCLAVDLAVSR